MLSAKKEKKKCDVTKVTCNELRIEIVDSQIDYNDTITHYYWEDRCLYGVVAENALSSTEFPHFEVPKRKGLLRKIKTPSDARERTVVRGQKRKRAEHGAHTTCCRPRTPSPCHACFLQKNPDAYAYATAQPQLARVVPGERRGHITWDTAWRDLKAKHPG